VDLVVENARVQQQIARKYLPDSALSPIERQIRHGNPQDEPRSPRGLTVAARPSPPPNPNYAGWDGSVEMISG
jgi:hypothetical protein